MEGSSRKGDRQRPSRPRSRFGNLSRGLLFLLLLCCVVSMPFLMTLETSSFSSSVEELIVQQMALFTQNSPTKTQDDQAYCNSTGSFHQIALRMANYSSPPGSRSYEKASKIFHSVTHYQMRLNTIKYGIFEEIHGHLSEMLKGFGLKIIYNLRSSRQKPVNYTLTVQVESVMDACSENCTDTPRIVMQSEQVSSIGYKFLKALKVCHHSQHCLIVDYSDFNYRWAQKNHIADSVLLLPVMTQSRLGGLKTIKPLHNRSLDVVFFTSVTEGRRVRYRESLIQNKTDWNIRFEYAGGREYMKDSYADARICLIMHYYDKAAAGEYHRLSEFAPMGCIPVLETFGDKFFLEPYQRCGRVVFADADRLTDAMEKVLLDIKKGNIDGFRHVEWWRAGIQWSEILTTLFGKENSKK